VTRYALHVEFDSDLPPEAVLDAVTASVDYMFVDHFGTPRPENATVELRQQTWQPVVSPHANVRIVRAPPTEEDTYVWRDGTIHDEPPPDPKLRDLMTTPTVLDDNPSFPSLKPISP
jgi:hypothetical protein